MVNYECDQFVYIVQTFVSAGAITSVPKDALKESVKMRGVKLNK